MSRSARLTLTLLLVLISPAAAQTGSDSQIPVADLPLTTVPTPQGRLLAVLLTGDGGWAVRGRDAASRPPAEGPMPVGSKVFTIACAARAR